MNPMSGYPQFEGRVSYISSSQARDVNRGQSVFWANQEQLGCKAWFVMPAQTVDATPCLIGWSHSKDGIRDREANPANCRAR